MRHTICRVLALPLLLLLLCSLLPCAQCAGRLQSFGMGYSQYAIYDKETDFFNYSLSSTAEFAVMTHFWATGADPAQIDSAVWRYYLDGESEASVQFQSALVAGVGFVDQTAPWGNKWMGKGAAGAAWYNNFRIPFHKSIRITGQLQPAAGQRSQATLWAIFRGTENLPTVIGGYTLPADARVVQTRIVGALFQPLDWVTVADVASGSGLLFSHTLAAVSSNQNFMEGCYHAYTPHDAAFPGITVSTGTEDYYDSAYYFNGGEFRQPNAGLTHFAQVNGSWQVSAYRIHEQDPIFFNDGFRLVWRVGDVNDKQGHKCTVDQGGDPAGDPQPTTVTSYGWSYVWAEQQQDHRQPARGQ